MKTSWRPFLQIRAPRYTSYPSALQFDESVLAADYAARLAEVGIYEPISLYVHVPFCKSLCWYCGCNMRVENDYSRARAYVDALIEEISTVGDKLGGRGRPVSVHFGGGTPNYLNNEDISRILGAIENVLGLTDDSRLAIELDPRLVGEGDARRLVDLGFTRLSFGLQDFDPAVQKAINREQSFELIERCVSDARLAGVDDLSLDILYGLPRQTKAKFSRTLSKVIALSPDRVSVFGYAHLPRAIRHQRLIDEDTLPNDAVRGDLAVMADDALTEAGYVRVGFDHYAKPDNALAIAVRERRLKRNFQGFTDEPADSLIAFGASAISFVHGLYAQNVKTIAGYMDAVSHGAPPVSHGVARTAFEERTASTIMSLLCRFEADVRPLLETAPPEHVKRMCAGLETFEEAGVIEWLDDTVRIHPKAHALARAVATAFDPYADASFAFAKAV